MPNEITPSASNKNFESIKKVDKNEIEYWKAHELWITIFTTNLIFKYYCDNMIV